MYVWRRCSCSSSRIQADRPAPRPRCLRRWGAWIGGACASEYCDALIAASKPSRLALRAGGDETHTDARRRLRRRKLELHYWDSRVCPTGSSQLRPRSPAPMHTPGAFYNVIWREQAACPRQSEHELDAPCDPGCLPLGSSMLPRMMHCNLCSPWSGFWRFSRPPKWNAPQRC